ncbi:RHS Repeat containing protein, partial [Escherichia coli EC1865]
RHGQAGERAYPRTGPGHPHPVCHRPGGKPPAGPGAAPGQYPHGVAG